MVNECLTKNYVRAIILESPNFAETNSTDAKRAGAAVSRCARPFAFISVLPSSWRRVFCRPATRLSAACPLRLDKTLHIEVYRKSVVIDAAGVNTEIIMLSKRARGKLPPDQFVLRRPCYLFSPPPFCPCSATGSR